MRGPAQDSHGPDSGGEPHHGFSLVGGTRESRGQRLRAEAAIEAAYGKASVLIRDLPASQGRYFIYLNSADRTQTVAIRGSANKQNAWADVDSLKVFDPGLKVFLHSGFKQAAEELYADAAPLLRKDHKTRITGHSLGGALACIFMMDLLRDGVPVERVVTFGQPKVTNRQGGKDFAGASYLRVINDRDAVAQAPASNLVYDLSGPYEHFGPEITLYADGKWTYSAAHVPRDFITGDDWKQLDLENATDHQIRNYIERLAAVK